LEIAVLIAHGLDQPGLFRIAGDQRRPSVTSPKQAVARVEGEAALAFVFRCAVTFVAALGEQGPNFALKEFVMLAG